MVGYAINEINLANCNQTNIEGFFFLSFFNVQLGIQLTETQTWRDTLILMPTVELLQLPNLWIERQMLFIISQFLRWRAVSCKVEH